MDPISKQDIESADNSIQENALQAVAENTTAELSESHSQPETKSNTPSGKDLDSTSKERDGKKGYALIKKE